MYLQKDMPLIQAIKDYLSLDNIRMHMPGHQGNSLSEVSIFLGDKLYKADLTELPTTDDLHAPAGAILAAENLAAQLYAAKSTVFIINGATQGIISLMMLDKEEKIILPRHAHKALYNSLILNGGTPVYIKSKINPIWGVAEGSDFNHYCSMAAKNLDAKQVWLTSPTYFGHSEDIRVYKKFMPDEAKLFVDEAHGAHYRFMGMDDAITQGAHGAVQSWHKTLGALTQSAVIHFSDEKLAERVRKTTGLTETTSPSYLLMASLDAARQNAALHGQRLFTNLLKCVNYLITELSKLDYVTIMPTNDLTKISIKVKGMSGYELFDCLVQMGIMPELAQYKFVLLMAGLSFDYNDANKIISAFKMLKLEKNRQGNVDNFLLPDIPIMGLKPREAFFANKKTVNIDESSGRISGEFVIPYPPGIPVLVPGEYITQEILEYLKYLSASKSHVQGVTDRELKYLEVIQE